MVISVGLPSGPHASTCGYCSPPGERSLERTFRQSAGLSAHQLSCQVYQDMIDHGWRRSGTWCYKPDLKASCCPLYTIRLDATAFKPSKSQRKLLNRWNRFVERGKEGSMGEERKPIKQKGKNTTEFELVQSVHASEASSNAGREFAHHFEVTLEPSSYTPEKFALYQKYQKEIHHEDEKRPQGFKHFLVDSPLLSEPIPYPTPPPAHLPTRYGSYHQLYKLDGQLIAMAVLDILPSCVSSVYFMYDNTWEEFSLGKLSALREISLASELCAAGAPGLSYLYLGYYVHSCQKMRYKGEYQPSYLCDPELYTWFPFNECAKLLDKYRYACFSAPEHSLEGPPGPDIVSEYEAREPAEVEDATLGDILMIRSIKDSKITVIPVNSSSLWNMDEIKREILCCIEGLGVELAKKIVFRVL
ncbi:Arginyl-tRNA--protein transferase 1 [Stygiomarasmius scandens]|uniref:arginyltransferase n=1 Tax=Marasmiellus scandens TaxID=2682957 RepID=A0ABR1K1A5_9AGAR